MTNNNQTLFLALSFLLAFLSGTTYVSANDNELFYKVFKKRPTKTTISLPIFNKGNYIGNAKVKIIGTNNITHIHHNDLTTTLFPLLSNKIQLFLNGKTTTQGWIDTKSMNDLGINLQYNYKKLRIKIDIPIELQNTRQHNLKQNNIPDWAIGPVKPEKISGYINYDLTKEISHNKLQKTSPFEITTDSAININGVIIENDLNYLDQKNKKIERNSTRIIYDDEKNERRYTLGDLSQNTSSDYHINGTMLGLKISKEFQINPYKSVLPVNKTDYVLKDDSRITVFLNNMLLRTLHQKAGKHSIKDLPLFQGVNDIKLDIETKNGKKETLHFKNHSSSDVLKKHTFDYSYTIGIESTPGNRRVMYDNNKKDTVISLFNRYGFSSYNTNGFFIKYSKSHHIEGIESLFSTAWGTFGLQAAFSRNRVGIKKHSGVVTQISYKYQDYQGIYNTPRSLNLSIEYLSPNFRTVDSFSTINGNTYLKYKLSFSRNILKKFRGSLATTYSKKSISEGRDPLDVSLNFSYSFKRHLHANLQLTHRKDSFHNEEKEIYLFLNFLIPQKNQAVFSSISSRDQERTLSYQYYGPTKLNRVNTRVDYLTNTSNNRYLFNTNFKSQRSIISAYHQTLDYKQSNQSSHITDLSLRSAIVFANNSLALSRPITNSFAIIKRNKHLSGETVTLNSQDINSDGKTDLLGAAVLPSLIPYRYKQIHIDTSKLSLGKSVGKENYTIIPKYKTGHLIEVGIPSSILLVTYLTDFTRNPIALETGIIQSSDNPDIKNYFFTNQKGRVVFEKIIPGNYILHFANTRFKNYKLTIPENVSGIYRIKQLKIESKK